MTTRRHFIKSMAAGGAYAALPGGFAFTATTADGKSQTKLVLPEGFNHSLKHKKAQSRQVCYFRKDELGAGDVTFTVTPMNCFGARGKSLATTFKA